MLSDGVKIRAQIDSESVRNVMLINGGGSVSLLALLPSVLGTPLVFAVLVTLAVWLLGLTLAAIHSILRRKCSLLHESYKDGDGGMRPPAGKRFGFIVPKQPWVCWWSWACLYSSIVAFLVGGILMVGFGFANLEALTSPSGVNAVQVSEVAQ